MTDREYKEKGVAAYRKLRIPFDYSLLKKEIAAKYRTQRNFARAIGISEHTISVKLNGEKLWRQDEIVRTCELLDIPVTAIPIYFFRVTAEREGEE